MNVLIAVASKHGSTREIADCIGEVIADEGFDVVVQDAADITGLDRYGAVIIGSALYFGQWQTDAMMFVRTNMDGLNRVPIWTFTSGHIVELPDIDQTANSSHLVTLAHAVDHRHFGGRLDRSRLNTVERILIDRVHARDSDERDWDEIRGWAHVIATSLRATQVVTP